MAFQVLLVDGREEVVDADGYTTTAEVGLKFSRLSEDGNSQEVVAEYHPRFWVRVVTPGAVEQAKTPDAEDFVGGGGPDGSN